jgi:hypothetical protein
MDFWFNQIFESGSAAVVAYPKVFVATLVLGVLIGWSAALFVLKNRLAWHKELVEHYEKKITDAAIPEIVLRRRRNRSAVSIWILGIVVIAVVAAAVTYVVNLVSPLVPFLPRHLTAEQQRIISEVHVPSDYGVKFMTDAGCVDCRQFAIDLASALHTAGWTIVSMSAAIGGSGGPPNGFGIVPSGNADQI